MAYAALAKADGLTLPPRPRRPGGESATRHDLTARAGRRTLIPYYSFTHWATQRLGGARVWDREESCGVMTVAGPPVPRDVRQPPASRRPPGRPAEAGRRSAKGDVRGVESVRDRTVWGAHFHTPHLKGSVPTTSQWQNATGRVRFGVRMSLNDCTKSS